MAVKEDKTRVQVTLPIDAVEQLDALRADSGLTRSAMIALAVADWLKKQKRIEAQEQ